MRPLPIAATGLAVALIAGGAGVTVVGASHQSSFSGKVRSLEQQWSRDQAEGVPASSLTPLRQALSSSQTTAAWWTPYWWGNTGEPLIQSLQQRTAAVWTAAMTAARSQAHAQISAWAALEKQLGQYVPAASTAEARGWAAELGTATTPIALQQLGREWAALVQQTTVVAQTAQQTAQLNAEVAGDGGVQGLLATAQKAVSTAQALNLDAGQVPSLISTVQSQVGANQDATASIRQLVGALSSLQTLISYNDEVAGNFRPVLLLVDEALAIDAPGAAALQQQYSAAQSALAAARETAQLQVVQGQISTLNGSALSVIGADVCGHNVGSGKVITVNLTLQEIVFYDNGCVAQAAPVTTGRALLRTPTGTFHIFYKQSPFRFISPWPVGSPFYYYPSWTNWVMEFDAGGYFIHDAPWEPNWQFGPGSEDSSGASHGCIHVPSSVMQWAYSWTPMGTPVVITY